ncbi:MAG: hypothetical protein B0D91_10695 [Oceanospirillales bacterium LUC14_002_19_P2]|nr:MAG: hypothetical protein B0D91_10695 [Oceanospirillales bacterium LUC14_002_19_P2]
MTVQYTKQMIDLLQVLRRRIKAEFDINIRFSSDDTINEIHRLVRQTRDSTTRTKALQFLQLAGLNITESDLEKGSAPTTHTVRPEPFNNNDAALPAPPITTKTRIYRGRVVA